MPKYITLADALVNLRRDLETARKQAKHEDLKFKIEDIEVEFQISAATEADGEVGASFWVLNMKTGGKQTDRVTHKVKLKLKPVPIDGKEVEISATGAKPE